jgi:hypothetical protein
MSAATVVKADPLKRWTPRSLRRRRLASSTMARS